MRALRVGFEIMEKPGLFLSAEDIEAGIRAAFRFVLGYNFLAYSANVQGLRRYKLRPKQLN